MSHAAVRSGLVLVVLAGLAACGSDTKKVDTSTPKSLQFVIQPGAAIAGEALAPAIDVEVLDVGGNPVTSTPTVTLALSGSVTLHGTATVTVVGGHATFTDLSVEKVGTGYTLTASSAGVTPVTSQAFDVAAAAPAASSAFTATPATLAAGETATLVATLVDAFGNTVPGADVVFSATGTGNTFTQPAATGANGIASGTLVATLAEAKTLTATVGTVTLSAHPVVTVTPAAPSDSVSDFVATPATLGTGEQVSLVATLRDAYANPIAGVDVVFAATGTGNTLTQPAASTGADGVASGSLVSTVAEAKTLTATVGTVTLSAQPVVTFTGGAPDPAGSEVTSSAATVVNDGTPVTITVTVGDAYGNALAGQTVTLSASGDASVTQPASPTSAAGTTTGTVSGQTAGTQTISAYVGATLLGEVDVTFYAVPDAGSSTVVASPATVPNDGFTPALVTVTVKDVQGRPVQGTAVGLTQTGTATIAPADATTGADGTAVFRVTSAAVGSTTVTASLNPGASAVAIPQQATVTFSRYSVYVQQPGVVANKVVASATLTGGTFSLSNAYSTSGNAFKYVSPNFYGTNSNSFVSLPKKVTGDFTMTATIAIPSTPKANTASGIGVGITTGFDGTDRYAYAVLPTSGGVAATRYVNSATNVNAANITPTVSFAIPTVSPITVTFSRSGANYSLAFNGGTPTVIAATSFTDGTTVYGAGDVFPCISFNNVVATVTSFVVQDGTGATLFDSATDILVPYTPASLAFSAASAAVLSGSNVIVTNGQTTDITATAVAAGGGYASVSAVPTDSTVVGVAVTNNATDSTLTLTGLKVGTTTVTVTNLGDPSATTQSKILNVVVQEFGTGDGYGAIAGKVYPAPSETAAYADGELSLTFDSAPVLNAGGSIDIYALTDGSLVDRVFFANEKQTVAGVTMTVGTQLVRVAGNTLYATPHFGKLAYGTSYYVGISTTAITGTLNGSPFAGFSNAPAVATWRFTTRAAPTLGTTINVDGSQTTTTADFRTLGGALMYLAQNPVTGATAITINVAAGTYTELVNYRAATPNAALTITIKGPSNARGADTVFQYTNGGNLNNQNGRASFFFSGASLVLENITLKNTGVRSVVAQAEALYFASGAGYTLAARNCTFSSNQDTVQTSGRVWIYDSFIEGNTDFIWGTSDVALFEKCDLRVINDTAGQTYSIFVARTGTQGAATVGKGYVLINSTVRVDDGITAAYGRDAGTGNFYDQVTILNNTFATATGGAGTGLLKTDKWVVTTAPLKLGDATYVGWKAAGNTGLGADTATTATGTAATVASAATEFDTRDHIINRVVTVTGGAPTGFEAAASTWDVSALATAWGAP